MWSTVILLMSHPISITLGILLILKTRSHFCYSKWLVDFEIVSVAVYVVFEDGVVF